MFELGTQWKKPCEFQGVRYNSITEMCDAFGILPETYNRRLKVYGWSMEKALTTPAKKNGGVAYYDHKGTRFKSFSKMCEAYGKSRKTVKYRLDNNWNLERALTT